MASSSSSSNSPCITYQSVESGTRAPLPAPPPAPPVAAADILAPLWWDERDWEFQVQSEDEEPPLTDGEEDLGFLADGELVSSDDAISWGEDLTDSEEEEEEETEEESSDEGYPPAKRSRAMSESDTWSEDESSPYISSSEEFPPGSSADGSDGDDDDDDFFWW